jgi:enamine deaminase RidA (YjgF/YER057c/UK114 family)
VDREPVVPARYAEGARRLGYSPGLRVGNTIHVSGHIGRTPDGELPADPETQIRQAFENVAHTLGEAGATWADVVEVTTYHVGLRQHADALVSVHHEFVQEPYPAWTAVGVTELYSPEAIVEVSVTAVVSQDRTA